MGRQNTKARSLERAGLKSKDSIKRSMVQGDAFAMNKESHNEMQHAIALLLSVAQRNQ